MRSSLALVALLLAWAPAARAQEEAPAAPEAAPLGSYRAYEPATRSFRCEIPIEGWLPMEEETAQGYAVHILGPDDPTGVYRTGIDVELFEPGQPGFVPAKKALEDLRRDDKTTGRSAGPVRVVRSSGFTARVFEVTETRRLPAERLPAASTVLHHFVAVVPNGESYFVLRLSSTRDVYLEHRKEFLRFLKKFRPLGYK